MGLGCNMAGIHCGPLGSTVLGSMGQLVDVNEHGAGPGCVIPQVESRGKAPKSLAALRYLKPEKILDCSVQGE